MPIIKPQNYHGRQGFNKAWADMTRRVHLLMLAKPAPRRLEPDPNPKYYRTLPIKIEHATLNHTASKRLRLLSRVPPGKYSEKYAPQPPPEHYVHEHNLMYVPTPRILELSKHRHDVKKKKRTKLSKRFQKMAKHKKTKIPNMAFRTEWLALRAVAKKIPPPPPIPKWKRTTEPLSPEEREIRIAELAQPSARYLEKPPQWDPYEVSKAAQKAKPSKRTMELANHRELPEEAQLDLAYKPFKIKRSALRCKASKRINELAEPFVKRKTVDTDVKEDAFTVPRRALKAKCTKRTKELAQPIIRKGAD